MATKKKVMVDDSVKVVKSVHQPKLIEEREDDDRVLPRYTVEDEEEEGDIVDTEYVESPEEMKKRILDIFFDATIVKKYDNTPLQKGWYGFCY